MMDKMITMTIPKRTMILINDDDEDDDDDVDDDDGDDDDNDDIFELCYPRRWVISYSPLAKIPTMESIGCAAVTRH